MRHIINVVSAAIVVIVVSCGGSKETTQSSSTVGSSKEPLKEECAIPAWFLNPPSDSDHIYSVKSAESSQMQLSIDKAAADARAAIAMELESDVKAMVKRFIDETGTNNNMEIGEVTTQVAKQVASQTLRGSRIKEQKPCRQGNRWISYVLMEYPMGSAKQALIENMKREEVLWRQFQASKAFQELDAEVKAKKDSK